MRIAIEQIVKPLKQSRTAKGRFLADGVPLMADLERLEIVVGGQLIHLERIDGTKGGYRYFFACPDCGRRCRVLFTDGSDGWACNSCKDTNRRTLNRSKNCSYYWEQAMKVAWRVDPTFSLGCKMIDWHTFPSKPKGMKWKTYYKHRRRYEKLFFKGLDLWLAGR